VDASNAWLDAATRKYSALRQLPSKRLGTGRSSAKSAAAGGSSTYSSPSETSRGNSLSGPNGFKLTPEQRAWFARDTQQRLEYLHEAQKLVKAGQFRAAETVLESDLQNLSTPGDTNLALLLFDVYARLGKYDRGLALLAPYARRDLALGWFDIYTEDVGISLRVCFASAMMGRTFEGQKEFSVRETGETNLPWLRGLFPDGDDAQTIAAISAFDLGAGPDKGLEFYLDIACKLAPGQPVFAETACLRYSAWGENEKAFRAIDAALPHFPHDRDRHRDRLVVLRNELAVKTGRPEIRD
jgi:tetratricopeptide (TPR) repeat protein